MHQKKEAPSHRPNAAGLNWWSLRTNKFLFIVKIDISILQLNFFLQHFDLSHKVQKVEKDCPRVWLVNKGGNSYLAEVWIQVGAQGEAGLQKGEG